MKKINSIGLDSSKSQDLAELLSDLLANYSVFYQNTRGFHWNIRGDKFFELHVKFEELYNDLFMKVDEIAERIRTLGFSSEHRYSHYLKTSKIKESNEVSEGKKAVDAVLESLTVLLGKQRNILSLSADINDEGTNALMSDYIRQQEKLVWMYSAFLNK
jgi:starvation-inducible DNA-binding protein